MRITMPSCAYPVKPNLLLTSASVSFPRDDVQDPITIQARPTAMDGGRADYAGAVICPRAILRLGSPAAITNGNPICKFQTA
jgi:hypothetical protein